MRQIDQSTTTAVQRYGAFIDHEFVEPEGGEYLEVINPASGVAWAEVPQCTAADVDRAVRSARRAFEEGDWPRFRAVDRAKLLIRFGQLLGEHADELAELQVRENGKLIREMAGQAHLLPEYFTYYAGLAQLMGGRTNAVPFRDMVNYTLREPLGVVAAITPWNSPILLLVWKLGPALAAGNTVVAKPSEVTPVSTLRLAELAREAGVPPGVFNVVTGLGNPAGTELTRHPLVDKVAFTGSTAVGRAIAAEAGRSLKRVSLELGGKSPNIVFDDADLPSAVTGLVAGIFGASGQTCMAGSRILLHKNIYDEALDMFVARAKEIKIGDPTDVTSEMGAVASREQLAKIETYVGIGIDEGARLLTGGARTEVAGLPGGMFVRPAVFADVRNDMRLAREEIFGPVAAVIQFDTEDEAIAIANDTDMGLAAGVWTGSVQRAHRVAGRVRAGTVWINNYRKTSYASPFGGYKQSGIGRENGPDALHEYTEVKSVWVDIGAGVKDPFNPRA